MNYKVILTKGEDGGYVASVPALTGCYSQGKTVEEALIHVKEAIRAYVAACRKCGDPIPRDQESIEAVVTFPYQEHSGSFSFA